MQPDLIKTTLQPGMKLARWHLFQLTGSVRPLMKLLAKVTALSSLMPVLLAIS